MNMKLKMLTATTAALLSMTAAQAQSVGPTVMRPGAPYVADGCGGFGSSVIRYIEETAADFDASARFRSGREAKQAVMREAKTKFDLRVRELISNPTLPRRWGPIAPEVAMPRMGNFVDALDKVDARTFHACFPQLEKLMADTETWVTKEQEAEAARQAAEAERQAATAKRLAEEEAERRRKAREHEAKLRAAAEEQAKREAEEQRVAAEKQRVAAEERAKLEADAAAIRAAERKVAAEERARREAEAAAILAEEQRVATEAAAKRRAAEEADEASPHGRVRQAYAAYGLVRYCYQIREGYAVKYVNDVELERAEAMIKAVVVKWKKEEPGMDTDLMWTQAMQRVQNKPIDAQSCTHYYALLEELSPVPAISIQKPL